MISFKEMQSVLGLTENHSSRHWFVGWANVCEHFITNLLLSYISKNAKFIIIFFQAPPFATKLPNNSVSGYTIQIFQYIAEKHGVT